MGVAGERRVAGVGEQSFIPALSAPCYLCTQIGCLHVDLSDLAILLWIVFKCSLFISPYRLLLN